MGVHFRPPKLYTYWSTVNHYACQRYKATVTTSSPVSKCLHTTRVGDQVSMEAIPRNNPTVLFSLFVFSVTALLFLWRLFFQSRDLRHIPGPLGARLTNFWLVSKYRRGILFKDIALDLNKRYGPVVRYGPRRVLFSDASAINVIFNTRNTLPKVHCCWAVFISPCQSLDLRSDQVPPTPLNRPNPTK